MSSKAKVASSFIRFYSNMLPGLALSEVVEKLEIFAPLSYAEKWDNVGLLLEPYKQCSIEKILLTNDLTEHVMQEAVEKCANMIISYHPPIFSPLKRITQNSWKERIVSICLSKSIALYSPHTAWDAAFGGVNDWLASAFSTTSIKPIQALEDCTSNNVGYGRVFSVPNGIPLKDAIIAVQKLIGLDVHVAIATDQTLNTKINKVAVCAGSGGSLLRGVKADLYVTGEMSHHEILDANHNNVSVILCNHSNSERGFLKVVLPKLEKLLSNACEVIISERDKDPLKTFVINN